MKALRRGGGERARSRERPAVFESHSSPVSSNAVQFVVSVGISNPVIVSLNDLRKFFMKSQWALSKLCGWHDLPGITSASVNLSHLES